jgi:hypothetical protein
MIDLKHKLKIAATALLQNAQGLLPKFSFDWEVLTSSVEGYLDARFVVLKIEIREMLTQVAERMAIGLVIILLGGIALMLFSIGLSLLVNELTDSRYAGFLVVALMYCIGAAAVGMYAKRKYFDIPNQAKSETDASTLDASRPDAVIAGAASAALTTEPIDWQDKWDLMPDPVEGDAQSSVSDNHDHLTQATTIHNNANPSHPQVLRSH